MPHVVGDLVCHELAPVCSVGDSVREVICHVIDLGELPSYGVQSQTDSDCVPCFLSYGPIYSSRYKIEVSLNMHLKSMYGLSSSSLVTY